MRRRIPSLRQYKNLIYIGLICLSICAALVVSFDGRSFPQADKTVVSSEPEKSRLIAQIDEVQAETLDPEYTDERSRPTFHTLPKGTVDYCEQNTDSFYNLSCGKRVYKSDVKTYKGVLPETNRVRFKDSFIKGRHLVLEFEQTFKAPFSVSFGEQDYKKPYPDGGQRPDYSISAFICDEVVIEFHYCPEISDVTDLCENGIFDSVSQDQSDGGYAQLRLKLKKKNQFCGYTAEYNQKGNLCFYFTNTKPVEKSDNQYGVSLAGKTVMLDAGHGGDDCGAKGNSDAYTEAALNLILCNAIKSELEDIGATVIMTRTDNTEVLLRERTEMVYQYKPDIFVSVHRNAAENRLASGYENYYYYPFSKQLAECVFDSVSDSFERSISVKYYPFYVNRTTVCPSILTENGFVSNRREFDRLKVYDNNRSIAKKTVQGIADYFQSLE